MLLVKRTYTEIVTAADINPGDLIGVAHAHYRTGETIIGNSGLPVGPDYFQKPATVHHSDGKAVFASTGYRHAVPLNRPVYRALCTRDGVPIRESAIERGELEARAAASTV
jgi:hypothetical protein